MKQAVACLVLAVAMAGCGDSSSDEAEPLAGQIDEVETAAPSTTTAAPVQLSPVVNLSPGNFQPSIYVEFDYAGGPRPEGVVGQISIFTDFGTTTVWSDEPADSAEFGIVLWTLVDHFNAVWGPRFTFPCLNGEPAQYEFTIWRIDGGQMNSPAYGSGSRSRADCL